MRNVRHTFKTYHYALLKLLVEHSHPIEAALAVTQGLSNQQMYGVLKGLSREETLMLDKDWKVRLLSALKQNGLTAEMLLDIDLSIEHCYALKELVKKCSISEALVIVKKISKYQAIGIQAGLAYSDVAELTNFWHIKALSTLKDYGLTADMLKHLNQNPDFDYGHYYALEELVKEHRITIQHALNMITGISNDKAVSIEEEYSQERLSAQKILIIGGVQETTASSPTDESSSFDDNSRETNDSYSSFSMH